MPYVISRNDITKIEVDAIVNAANTDLKMGGGVCGAIFKAAGAEKLKEACKKLAPIKTGEAVITPGFDLKAKYIIHTAGPIYGDGKSGEEKLLLSCYANSLKLAEENKCESIAFPLISSGIYGYPKKDALHVATQAIQDFLQNHDMNISLIVFDKDAFSVSKKLLGNIESYIDENYVDTHYSEYRYPPQQRAKVREESAALFSKIEADINEESCEISIPESKAKQNIDAIIFNLDEPFSDTLIHLISEKGKTDVEVYKRANIDRRHFSKIRTGNGYVPGKQTVISLAIALELSLKETVSLLKKAGYALSDGQKFDVIIEYFIINGIYDIFTINEVLFHYDLPLLGV